MPTPSIQPGAQFGQLTVIAFAGHAANHRHMWLCRCTCGVEKVVRSDYLRGNFDLARRNQTISCGCRSRAARYTSTRIPLGEAKTPEYDAWRNLVRRCTNPKCAAWKVYGGRGITVCERWRGEHGFENFLADMGRRPGPDFSIDRINNDGNYEPGNCRWATKAQQLANQRHHGRFTKGFYVPNAA